MSDAKAEDADLDEKPKKSGGNKIVLMAIAMNVMLTGGVMAFVLLKGGSAEAKDSKKPDAAAAGPAAAAPGALGAPAAAPGEHGAPGAPVATGGPMVRIENIVVHLRNPEIDRYARIAIDLELLSPPDLALFQSAQPKVRDRLISILSDRTFEDVTGGDALTRLKADLLKGLADAASPAHVKALYISDFVVQ